MKTALSQAEARTAILSSPSARTKTPRTKRSLIPLKQVQALPKVLSGTRPAPQKRSKRGGYRLGSGGKPGNQNARRRRPTPWPEELGREMSKPEGFWAFLQNMAREAWIQNVLDARMVGALNSTFRLMADLKGWIEKAPLVIQAQTAVSVDLQELLKHMSRESRFELAKAVRKLEMEHRRD